MSGHGRHSVVAQQTGKYSKFQRTSWDDFTISIFQKVTFQENRNVSVERRETDRRLIDERLVLYGQESTLDILDGQITSTSFCLSPKKPKIMTSYFFSVKNPRLPLLFSTYIFFFGWGSFTKRHLVDIRRKPIYFHNCYMKNRIGRWNLNLWAK